MFSGFSNESIIFANELLLDKEVLNTLARSRSSNQSFNEISTVRFQ